MALPIQPSLVQVSPNMRGGVVAFPPLDLAAATAATLFEQGVVESDEYLQYMRIQNVGTGVVKVCIDGNVASAAKYNFCLRVDTGAEAGAGGACEVFGSWDVRKVSVISTAGSKICVTKVVTPRSVAVLNY